MVTYGRLNVDYLPEIDIDIKSTNVNEVNKNNSDGISVLPVKTKKAKNIILRDKLKLCANIIGGLSGITLFVITKQYPQINFINNETLQIIGSGLFSYNLVRYSDHNRRLINDLDDKNIEESSPVKKLTY